MKIGLIVTDGIVMATTMMRVMITEELQFTRQECIKLDSCHFGDMLYAAQ